MVNPRTNCRYGVSATASVQLTKQYIKHAHAIPDGTRGLGSDFAKVPSAPGNVQGDQGERERGREAALLLAPDVRGAVALLFHGDPARFAPARKCLAPMRVPMRQSNGGKYPLDNFIGMQCAYCLNPRLWMLHIKRRMPLLYQFLCLRCRKPLSTWCTKTSQRPLRSIGQTGSC